MYNVQTETFFGKGRDVFKRRDHVTEDVFYVAPRGPLNLLSSASGTLHRWRRSGWCNFNEAPVDIQCKITHSCLAEKFLPLRFQGRARPVHRDEGDAHSQTKCERSRPSRQACALTSLLIVDQELDRPLNLGVIKPVRHADWAAPVMVVIQP